MINVIYLEKQRKKADISIYALTKRLEMSRQSYYNILRRGTTTWKTLEKIAGILGCRAKDLIK